MGEHGSVPKRGSPELAGGEAVAALLTSMGVQVAWVKLVATLQWCAWSFVKLGATGWLWRCWPVTRKMASELGGCSDPGYEMEICKA